jgi:sec-independent protein translocase protein TatC
MWQAALNKVFKAREKVAINLNKEDEEKPFLDHLEDLRTMLVRMATTLFVSAFAAFAFYKQLFNILLYPMVLAGFAPDIEAARKLLINLDIAGPFMMAVNVSLIAAVIASFPLLLIFLLQFILPGLKTTEKKLLFPAIGIGTGLFLGGCTFAYWQVLPRALVFFSEFAESVGATQTWSLDNYVTFTTRFILVFGIAFELPVIVMALVKLDILNYRIMKSTWRYALIAIMIFAAIITPTPDILTLLLMSGPLYVLYGICVVLAYFMDKKDKEAYPEYHAQLAKDEAELEKEVDDWDKDGYTPWFSDEEDADIEDEYQQRTKTEDKPKPAPDTPDTPDTSDSPSPEPTLEELARQDELGSDSPPGSDPAKNQD